METRWRAVGAWLRRVDPERYDKLVEELERAYGCRADENKLD